MIENIDIKLIVLSMTLMLSVLISTFAYASEQTQNVDSIESEYIEIEIVDKLNLLDNETEFFYAKSTITDYEGASLDSRDILRTIPSINSKDNKVLGLVMPPFAFFKTKF